MGRFLSYEDTQGEALETGEADNVSACIAVNPMLIRAALRQVKLLTETAEQVLDHKVRKEAGASHADKY